MGFIIDLSPPVDAPPLLIPWQPMTALLRMNPLQKLLSPSIIPEADMAAQPSSCAKEGQLLLLNILGATLQSLLQDSQGLIHHQGSSDPIIIPSGTSQPSHLGRTGHPSQPKIPPGFKCPPEKFQNTPIDANGQPIRYPPNRRQLSPPLSSAPKRDYLIPSKWVVRVIFITHDGMMCINRQNYKPIPATTVTSKLVWYRVDTVSNVNRRQQRTLFMFSV